MEKQDKRYTAVFALREQVGGRGLPYLTYEILSQEETWHEKVQGDGGSYRPGGPESIESSPGESLKEFEKRVSQVANAWEADD
jgi:broad specificity phosphatase PhoE